MRAPVPSLPSGLRGLAKHAAIELERRWDAARLARRAGRAPEHFRIVSYGGHGGVTGVVVRGRALDDAEPPAATEGEGVWAAVARTAARFLTDDLPGVALRVRLGAAEAETVTDDDGYFQLSLDHGLATGDGPWAPGTIELTQPYRGIAPPCTTPVLVRVPGPRAAYGVVSDVDDTILDTGAQRVLEMVRRTFTGSALTRTPLAGAPSLYRAFAHGRDGDADNPVFYVSSSPWNLHDFLVAFLAHRDFPAGPLLLRDFLGTDARRDHATSKHEAIAEVLRLHPGLPLVLVGDSGQHDPEIYAEVARRHPERILAVYIREVRLDPGDGRVEAVIREWDERVPIVVAADSAAIARHAAQLGLISAEDAAAVERQTAGARQLAPQRWPSSFARERPHPRRR